MSKKDNKMEINVTTGADKTPLAVIPDKNIYWEEEYFRELESSSNKRTVKLESQLEIAKKALNKIMLESMSDGTQQLPPNNQSMTAYEALAIIEELEK